LGSGYGGGLGAGGIGSLSTNIANLARKYPVGENGKFGVKGSGNSRVVFSQKPEDTAREFFSKLGAGGRVEKLASGKGLVAKFPDGSRVNLRLKSKTGSPAVDISNKGTKSMTYKIHFEFNKEKEHK
jgi:hypothetical protein